MKKAKRTGVIVLRGILILLLVINVTVILLERIKGSQSLEHMPFGLLAVEGGSMEPTLHHGDGVLVWHTPFEKIREGDLIVFLQDGELVTHRVIERNGEVLTAKGTANDIEDEPVTERNYRAKVLCRIPAMGSLGAVYESPSTFIVFAVLLFLLIFGKDIFAGIYKRFFEKKKL